MVGFGIFESLFEETVPELRRSSVTQGTRIAMKLLTAMIFPVPVPSPGLGMAKRRVMGFSRKGLASQGRAPTTAANGAMLWKFSIRFSMSRPSFTKPKGSPNES